jgi:hypothetical protein
MNFEEQFDNLHSKLVWLENSIITSSSLKEDTKCRIEANWESFYTEVQSFQSKAMQSIYDLTNKLTDMDQDSIDHLEKYYETRRILDEVGRWPIKHECHHCGRKFLCDDDNKTTCYDCRPKENR